MKFLSSSSSSAASTTTSPSCSGSKSNTRSPTAGCLAGMLSQFLCFNCLPTRSSDQFKDTDLNAVEFDNLGCWETEEKVGATATPGIVARLMGLESMPQIDLANAQVTPNSMARSRSMDYDSWSEGEPLQGQRPRVGTSLSFRELPTFLELENDEFFVINFGNGSQNKEFRSKGSSRSESGSGKLKRRKAERCKRKCEKGKENQEPNRVVSNEKVNRRIDHKVSQEAVSNGEVKDASSNVIPPANNCNRNSDVATEALKLSKPINHRESSNGGKQRKEKEENVYASKVETECSEENSSPVSVLDFGEAILDPEEGPPTSSEEDVRSTGSNSRRKLSAELENFELSPPSPPPCKPSSSSTSDVQRRKLIHGKCRKKDCQRWNYVEMWGEICKIAEGAMMESNWVYRELWKVEDFKGIGAEFGLQILETLLNEMVDQLVETM